MRHSNGLNHTKNSFTYIIKHNIRPHRASSVLRANSKTSCNVATNALCRLLAVSDTHFDYKENLEWCKRLSNDTSNKNNILILAGDACDSLNLLEETLGILSQSFAKVFFCYGNHELWVRSAEAKNGITDSITKLQNILDICYRLNIATAPQRVGNVWIAPLHSWHHSSFDKEPDIPGIPAASSLTLADYAACRWPKRLPGGDTLGSIELAQWFDSLNDGPAWEELIRTRNECDVVSFSHFLPHQKLLPEKRFLFYPNLMKGVGSDMLQERMVQMKPNIHVFGHTHFSWDQTIDGVRYIQAPLCSPSERKRRLRTVCFDASLAQAIQDPEQALWLPLEIYKFELPQSQLDSSLMSPSVGVTMHQEEAVKQKITEVLFTSDDNTNASQQPNKVHKQEPCSTDDERLAVLNECMHLPKRKRGVFDSEAEVTLPSSSKQQLKSSLTLLPDDDDDDVYSNNNSTSSSSSSSSSEEEHMINDDPSALNGTTTRSTAYATTEIITAMANNSGKQVDTVPALMHGEWCGQLHAHWSDYYALHPRTPEIIELASWVAEYYSKRRRRLRNKKAVDETTTTENNIA